MTNAWCFKRQARACRDSRHRAGCQKKTHMPLLSAPVHSVLAAQGSLPALGMVSGPSRPMSKRARAQLSSVDSVSRDSGSDPVVAGLRLEDSPHRSTPVVPTLKQQLYSCRGDLHPRRCLQPAARPQAMEQRLPRSARHPFILQHFRYSDTHHTCHERRPYRTAPPSHRRR